MDELRAYRTPLWRQPPVIRAALWVAAFTPVFALLTALMFGCGG